MVKLTVTIPLYGEYIANRYAVEEGMVVFKQHFYFRVLTAFVDESLKRIKLDLELITGLKETLELAAPMELPHPVTVLSITNTITGEPIDELQS